VLLAEKSVVITGAGSGVGRASALRFAEEGARVVCADVREDWAKGTVRLVTEAGGAAIAQRCDVVVESDVAGAIDAAVSFSGRLDVMFNNAGVTGALPGKTFEQFEEADWQRLVDINLRGVFFGCKHAVATFKKQGGGGAIVNTGSVAGIVGFGSVIYGVTKGGVIQLTRAVAIECAPFDIRVNAICPAAMPATNFTLASPDQAFQAKPAEMIKAIGGLHPLGRPITAEDCAEAALFLASDRARNITGVLLPIDGGYTAR
jgi:NAD(P)-dependent dehydrogenase (short-subunit alcohol dehydrogenase family)